MTAPAFEVVYPFDLADLANQLLWWGGFTLSVVMVVTLGFVFVRKLRSRVSSSV